MSRAAPNALRYARPADESRARKPEATVAVTRFPPLLVGLVAVRDELRVARPPRRPDHLRDGRAHLRVRLAVPRPVALAEPPRHPREPPRARAQAVLRRRHVVRHLEAEELPLAAVLREPVEVRRALVPEAPEQRVGPGLRDHRRVLVAVAAERDHVSHLEVGRAVEVLELEPQRLAVAVDPVAAVHRVVRHPGPLREELDALRAVARDDLARLPRGRHGARADGVVVPVAVLLLVRDGRPHQLAELRAVVHAGKARGCFGRSYSGVTQPPPPPGPAYVTLPSWSTECSSTSSTASPWPISSSRASWSIVRPGSSR